MRPRLFRLATPFLFVAAAAAQTAPAAPSASESAIKLDPFEVQSGSDKGYSALNSNAITAFNTQLNKMSVSADIFDQAFMDDVAATSVEGLITGYSAGAGNTTPDSASGGVASAQAGDRISHGHLALRGLVSAYSLRDTLLPNGLPTEPGSTGVGFTSSFDVERVELVNGPQALLYGSTGAGGVTNMVSKQARLGAPSFGSMTYQIDKYGSKMGLLDYGASAGQVAIRFDLLGQSFSSQRINIGGPLQGYYLQLAAQVGKNTVVRLEGEQTTYNRYQNSSLTLNAGSTAIDARHGDHLSYLLATNQVQQAASGPSGAGPIDNGLLNWSNVSSYMGWWATEKTIDSFSTLSIDTNWNDHLSTKVMAGYLDWNDYYYLQTPTFYAPVATTNPIPGNWTLSEDGTNPEENSIEHSRNQALRCTALLRNDLFGGKDNSQTIFGFDFLTVHFDDINYALLQADSNWNVVYNGANTSLKAQGSPGAISIPTLNWTVNHGPVQYPFWIPSAARVTYNGVNYVRVLSNVVNPNNVSPADPGGETLGGDDRDQGKLVSRSLFGTNYTEWLDGKLTTLAGVRLEYAYDREDTAGDAPPSQPLASRYVGALEPNFNFGVNYRLTDWLRPYASVSSSFAKPSTIAYDVYGNQPKFNHAIGEEVGVKVQDPSGSVSGSLAFYHVKSKDEQEQFTSTLENDINPSGLNGVSGNRDNYLLILRQSEGVQLTLTAQPTQNWRLRWSAGFFDGSIGTSASFPQVYNDQFHENSSGQVTYADGTVVYVPATYNSKTLTTSATTPGAVPLTVTMLSSPTSSYYATPKAVNGQITASSAGGKVLKVVDPTHGAILTGATGLPISALQIDPSLAGVQIPGTIVVQQAGDATTGYPEISTNLLSVYDFSTGWEKGFEVGGSANLNWKYRDYYYYPNGFTSPASARTIFSLPSGATFGLIAGYRHKFGHVGWRTQLNVANLFNHYTVILIPGEVSGWTAQTGIYGSVFGTPRQYTWTNTLTF